MLAAALLTCAVLCGQAEARSPDASSDVAAAVKKLIVALDAPEKAQRDQAEQALLELGPAALDHLPAITAKTPAEVKSRLERVQRELERQWAVDVGKATLVTLTGDDAATLGKALAAIEKQTGNRVVPDPEELRKVAQNIPLEVQVDQLEFWKAVDLILDDARLTTYAYADDEETAGALAVRTASETLAPRHGAAAYAGSFRIAATEIMARRNLLDATSDSLQVTLETAWEPRLKPIALSMPAEDLLALDENGAAIPLATVETVLQYPIVTGTTAMELPLSFALPARSVTRIASLKGHLTVLVPGRMATFRFSKLDGLVHLKGKSRPKPAQQTQADVQVTIDRVAKSGEVWEVRVQIAFSSSGSLESHYDFLAHIEAHLEGSDGKPIEHAGLETLGGGEHELALAWLFDLPEGPKGHTFVLTCPASVLEVPVDFELKEIKLP